MNHESRLAFLRPVARLDRYKSRAVRVLAFFFILFFFFGHVSFFFPFSLSKSNYLLRLSSLNLPYIPVSFNSFSSLAYVLYLLDIPPLLLPLHTLLLTHTCPVE